MLLSSTSSRRGRGERTATRCPSGKGMGWGATPPATSPREQDGVEEQAATVRRITRLRALGSSQCWGAAAAEGWSAAGGRSGRGARSTCCRTDLPRRDRTRGGPSGEHAASSTPPLEAGSGVAGPVAPASGGGRAAHQSCWRLLATTRGAADRNPCGEGRQALPPTTWRRDDHRTRDSHPGRRVPDGEVEQVVADRMRRFRATGGAAPGLRGSEARTPGEVRRAGLLPQAAVRLAQLPASIARGPGSSGPSSPGRASARQRGSQLSPPERRGLLLGVGRGRTGLPRRPRRRMIVLPIAAKFERAGNRSLRRRGAPLPDQSGRGMSAWSRAGAPSATRSLRPTREHPALRPARRRRSLSHAAGRWPTAPTSHRHR